MNKVLKSALIAIVCLFAIQLTAVAGDDKPINANQLPATAQQLIKRHFSSLSIALAKVDAGMFGRDYEVMFNNGMKIEFDKSGNWTEIDCRKSAVPSAIVPQKIASYVNKNYPGAKILRIERGKKEYEVKLSNGLEVNFNKSFQVTDID